MRPQPTSPAHLLSERSTHTERLVSRTEWLWLLGAILFGAILRLSFPGRMAVEHFDEGVYASNFWFEVEQGGEYPARHLYAPPLLPIAIEWTMIVAALCGIKPTGCIPMIPSLIAGLATIPSLWWVGRRWFGPSAGIVAAWLVAASDFHASYSRAALTDVPVCLFMLWAVYFLWQALQTGTRRDILLAGLFTGLAWWTKYNGWLPLAIGLSGGAAWQLSLPRAERNLRQFLTRWSLVALTAFAVWLPVLWGLQKHGGYAAVAANHRQYLVGFAGWNDSARRQLWVVGRYENWLGAAHEANEELRYRSDLQHMDSRERTTGLRPMSPAPIDLSRLSPELDLRFARMWEALNYRLSLATLPLLFVLATWGLALGLLRDCRKWRGLGLWLVAAWLVGLTLTTPLYHPYPRLMLPWLVACWIGVAFCAELSWERGRVHDDSPQNHFATWKPTRLELVVLASLMAVCALRSLVGTTFVWRDHSEYQVVSRQIVDKIRGVMRDKGFQPHEAIIYVLGEPAVLHGLRSNGLPLTVPIQDMNFSASPQVRPTFFIFSKRTFQNAKFSEEWNRQRSRFTPVFIPRAGKSPLVRFDEPLHHVETDFLNLFENLSSIETFYVEQLDR